MSESSVMRLNRTDVIVKGEHSFIRFGDADWEKPKEAKINE